MPKAAKSDLTPTLAGGARRKSGRRQPVDTESRARKTSSLVVTQSEGRSDGRVKRKRKHEVASPNMTNVNIIQSTSTFSQSGGPHEVEVLSSAPAVFKGAKRILFQDSVVGEGAFGAVGGNMYIGCIPEASSSSDTTLKQYLPSVMEDAEDITFGRTQIVKGALSATAGNLVIAQKI